jgi:hypothetical protein
MPLPVGVTTREGTPIPIKKGQNLDPGELRDAEQIFLEHQHLRGRIELRSVDNQYNCMGMVFATRRGYIDIDSLDLIQTEDGYTIVQDVQQLQPGDIVVYGDPSGPTHVATVVGRRVEGDGLVEVRCLSKWGAYGEYFHPLEILWGDYGRPIRYLTDRQ